MVNLYSFNYEDPDIKIKLGFHKPEVVLNNGIIKITNNVNSSIAIISSNNNSLNVIIVNLSTTTNFFESIIEYIKILYGLQHHNQKIIDINTLINQFIQEDVIVDFQNDKFIIRLNKKVSIDWTYEKQLYFTTSIVFNNLEKDAPERLKKRIKNSIKRIVDVDKFIDENQEMLIQNCNILDYIKKISLINLNSFYGGSIATFKKFCKAISTSKSNFVNIFENLKEEEVFEMYNKIYEIIYIKQKQFSLYSKYGVHIIKTEEENLQFQLINNIPISYLNFKIIFALIKTFEEGDINV